MKIRITDAAGNVLVHVNVWQLILGETYRGRLTSGLPPPGTLLTARAETEGPSRGRIEESFRVPVAADPGDDG